MNPLPLLLAAAVAPSLAAQRQFVPDRVNPDSVTRWVGTTDWDGNGTDDLLVLMPRTLLLVQHDGLARRNVLRLELPGVAGDAVNGLIGDLDSDGDPDALILGQTEWFRVTNDGGGNASVRAEPGSPNGFSWPALVDLDHDGYVDLVRSAGSSGVITSRNVNGNGFVDTPMLPPGWTRVFNPAIGDFDNDGHDDLFAVDGVRCLLALSRPGGPIDRSDRVAAISTSGTHYSVDTDLDGRDDIVRTATGRFELWLNDGNAFRLRSTAGTALGSACFADLDGDGDTDVAGLGGDIASSGRPAIFIQDGSDFVDETLARMEPGSQAARDMVAGDFDADGDVDLYIGASFLGFSPAADVLLTNRERHLYLPTAPRLGQSTQLTMMRRPGFATGLTVALAAVGDLRATAVSLPFGRLHLEPGEIRLPPVVLTPPHAIGDVTVPVPADPALMGWSGAFQALIVPVTGGLPSVLTDAIPFEIR